MTIASKIIDPLRVFLPLLLALFICVTCLDFVRERSKEVVCYKEVCSEVDSLPAYITNRLTNLYYDPVKLFNRDKCDYCEKEYYPCDDYKSCDDNSISMLARTACETLKAKYPGRIPVQFEYKK